METDCGSGPQLAQARIKLSVAKCEASEKWWPTWHWGRGGRKQYPGQPFAWGNILIHHPPLASFLAGDTCKLISSLCYLVKILILQIHLLLLYSDRKVGSEKIKEGTTKRNDELQKLTLPKAFGTSVMYLSVLKIGILILTE